LTITLGRQELRFGNGMIVGDPDTNNQVAVGLTSDPDLSSRKAFDAIRLTLNYDPLVVDLVASQIAENLQASSDDVTLYGINAAYALNKKINLEGYYFSKFTGRENTTGTGATVRTVVDRVDTIGGRIVASPIEKLTYQLEGAYQVGKIMDAQSTNVISRRAWAVETALTYAMPNVKMSPMLTACYSYYTGNKNDSGDKYRAWDPMFEDQVAGSIANAQFDQSNAHIAGAIAQLKPKDDVTLKGEYYAYWWDKAYANGQVITSRRGDTFSMSKEKFAGQEVDLTAIYDYTEDVQLSLLTGILIPGSAFDSANSDLATEVIGSMKVTF